MSNPFQPQNPAAAAAVIVQMIEAGEWSYGLLPGGITTTELIRNWAVALGGTADVTNMSRDAQLLYILALMQRSR